MPLLKQLAHCPDKRQHSPTNANKHQQTPTNTNKHQQLGQCAPAVGVCCPLSGTVGRVQHVQSDWVKLQNVCPMQRDFKHSDSSSDSSQLSSTRVHNILELSWMSLLCWLSASLFKKKRYHKSIYRLAYPNERFSRQIFVYFNFYDSFNTATCFLILMLKVTLHEYVCAYVSYRPLPLHSNYRVGFRNINMHAVVLKVLAPSEAA